MGVRTKLTAADIPEIHRAYREGQSTHAIGQRYGVDPRAVLAVLRCESWRHVWAEPTPIRSKTEAAPRGERHPAARTTDAVAAAVRGMAREGVRQADIAARFGVSRHTVKSISGGQSWRHLSPPGGPPNAYKRHGRHSPHARLDDDKVREIRRLASEGVAQRPLARRFGVSQQVVGRIVNRQSWKHVP